MMPGKASKVCVGGWVVVDSEFSDRFGYSLRLALAKPNNILAKHNTESNNVSIIYLILTR